jgi:hypothetical protein
LSKYLLRPIIQLPGPIVPGGRAVSGHNSAPGSNSRLLTLLKILILLLIPNQPNIVTPAPWKVNLPYMPHGVN